MSSKKIFLIVLHIVLALIILSACISPGTQDMISYQDTVSDMVTFRAEVLEFDPSFVNHPEELLFVRSITPPVDSHGIGGRYFVRRGVSTTVLNELGEPISYSDILPDTIVDITFSGMVGERDPGVIFDTILIQIVE